MTKYAFVFHDHYVPLIREGGTLENAIKMALEEIYNNDYPYDYNGDTKFEIIEIANTTQHKTSDHKDFFDKKTAEWKKHQKEQQDRIDKEQYEKLKQKFGK